MLKGLGYIGGGMSCDFLRLWSNDTDFPELLQSVSEQPGGLRAALRKCVVEQLRSRPLFDLGALSPRLAVTLPVKMVEELSNASFRALLDHLTTHFDDFLTLPHHKQRNLADRAALLGSAEEQIEGAALDLLGPLLPFLDRDRLSSVDRRALAARLEDMRGFCVPKEALRDISALLTHRDLLGSPSKWQVEDVEHLGRLVFSLSSRQIHSIPLAVLSRDTVEQVLMGQKRWAGGAVGGVCESRCTDGHQQRERTLSLIRGVIKARSRRVKVPVPSCADIRATYPSVWTPTQLSRMSQEDVQRCVEALGQDDSLSAEQRRALWVKLRKSFSPVKALRPHQVLALGSLVTEMGERELMEADLSDPGLLAHLGTLTGWSHKKMRAVLVAVMRRRRLKAEQLSVVDLAAFGHLICGLSPSEISRLDPYNLSVAAGFLREATLPCSEQQMEALTRRLSLPEAFGPVSTWGAEVFTEVGTLAAGLEDLILSALVQEQVEGLSPAALSLMAPRKMAVVFSAEQLSWLSVEQAWALTEEQWAELDGEQRHQVGLARYEGDVLLEMRGRSCSPPPPPHSLSLCPLAVSLLLQLL
ncbi:stereocilin-like [Genypterus blacodes]|uniref:stereocilin-like n=1 Tax=Genypterus blacodes TaxID=154954 RepID=UPI003F776D21